MPFVSISSRWAEKLCVTCVAEDGAADGDDADGLRHLRRGGEHGGSAEAVADQERRRRKIRT